MKKASPFHGLLVVDKPGGMTSRAAVDRAQGWFPRGTRIGHTGTLDPLATGVLVLCLGAATRLTEYVQRMDKVYTTRLLLGARSDTDDADGTVEPVTGAQPPEQATIARCLQGFIGTIEQVPPSYSAAWVTGRRAYDLARGGAEVDLQPRRVRIHGIDIQGYAYPMLDLQVHCGKGTYIRSIARDLGERLGCGALVETLRRTRVGPFEATAGVGLEEETAVARSRLLPVAAAVAQLPALHVSAAEVARLRQGQAIAVAELPEVEEVAVFDAADVLVAVGRLDVGKRCVHPTRVLPAQL